MATVCRFLIRFASLIVNTLHSFDRVLFKGHLPLASPEYLEYFVDRILRIRRTDFIKIHAPAYAERIVEHARQFAQRAGRTYLYRTGSFRKDDWARQLLQTQRITEGLIGILCTQETCNSFQLIPGDKRPRFVTRPRQQRVLYYYFLDPQLGFIHVRLQTWLPFTTQIYVNGHDWLAQQMARRRLGFVQQHNAFTQLDDPAQAQRLADRFAHLDWTKILNRFARRVNPLFRDVLKDYNARWAVDQAEFATDLLFTNRDTLRGLYRKLLEHAVLTFSAKDVLGFLGRKWDRRFDGEVQTEYKADRWPGMRIKHRMRKNWLKMYDKFETILRVETVINAPQEFIVSRPRHHRDGTTTMGWYPMTKSVESLSHYRDQALACNRRYLDALAVVNDPTPAYAELKHLTEPRVVKGRSYAGFNPARREDVRLFAAVLAGDGIARGFRNRDVREAMIGSATASQKPPARRASAVVGRWLKRLHVRNLVAKVPRSRRWQVTDRGRTLLALAIQLYGQTWPQLAA